MSYSITTKDGITINNIPDDVDPNSQSLRDRVAQIRASSAQPSEQAPEPETTLGGLAGAATRGIAPIATGAALGAAAGAPFAGVGAIPGALAGAGAAGLTQLVGDPLVSGINALFGTRYKTPTDAMGDLLSRLGVPQADTEAERIVQSIAGGAAGGLGGVAAGQAIKAAAGQAAPAVAGVGRAMAAAPAAQVLGGAGAGGAAQTATEMGVGPGGQLAAGLAGGIVGAKTAGPARVPVADQGRAGRIVQQAQARGIPVLTSDVAPPKTFIGKTFQQLGERVPIAGTGPLRARQQEARTAAVRELLTEFGAADAVDMSPNLIKDIGQQRAELLSKYATLKRDVIGKVSDAGGEVPLTKTMTEIDNQIAALTERRSGSANEAIERLQQIKNDLQGRTLNQLESYRADELAAAFKDDPVRPMTVAARDIGEKALRAIYGPVRQDMGDFIKANGDRRDFEKWMVSNRRLSEMQGEVRQGALKSVIQSGNATPEVVNRMLFSAKPSEINQLYGQLSQDGRGMARTAILRRAADKAMYRTTTGDEMFSPDLFAREIKRLEPQVGIFFSGANKAQVEGLARALNLTKRAAEAGVSTASGQQAVPFAIGSFLQSMLGSFGGAIATAGGAGGVARLYESAPIRNLMIQLSRTKPGAKDEAAIFKRIAEATRAEQQAQEPPRLEVLGVSNQEQQ